jgi:Fic family protein
MKELLIPEKSDEIINTVASSEAGKLFSELFDDLKNSMSRRTLQRRLEKLVSQKKLIHSGSGRSSRYEIAIDIKAGVSVRLTQRNLEFSPAAILIKENIERPIEQRERVTYQHQFLSAYLPNKNFYLSERNRQHLMSIGAQSNGKRPAGTFAKKIFHKIIIDLAWNSSRLEGNTYSLLETEKLLFENVKNDQKSLTETQMILNHKAAIEFLIDSADIIDFNRFTIFNLHALLSNNLLGNPASCGRIRNIPVGIGKTVYEPLNIPALLDERFNNIMSKASNIADPFEQAFFALVHLPYLQPFEDVNKRVSRVSANIPFIKHNLSPLSFIDVPENDYISSVLAIYELNDTKLMEEIFVWAYERSAMQYSSIQKITGEPDPFRLKFQLQLKKAVQEVIKLKLSKAETPTYLRNFVIKAIAEEDYSRFISVVEEELLGLHSGNIALYKITSVEFEDWQKIWK